MEFNLSCYALGSPQFNGGDKIYKPVSVQAEMYRLGPGGAGRKQRRGIRRREAPLPPLNPQLRIGPSSRHQVAAVLPVAVKGWWWCCSVGPGSMEPSQ
jgi:hypothetical protein